jgi:hypothetical protein
MDGWSAYEKLVLDKLEGLETGLEELRGEVVSVRIDVATLKVKAGIWGGVAGLVPALITALVAFVGGN